MKTTSFLIICLIGLLAAPAMATDAHNEPVFSLTANADPLGDLLQDITRQTGYQFTLNSQWADHPVSAAITNVPLEQGLKRLLRSLNHTIIWESDRRIIITVVDKVDPVRPDTTVSYGAPPREAEPDIEPPANSDTVVEVDSESEEAAQSATSSTAADRAPKNADLGQETDAAGGTNLDDE